MLSAGVSAQAENYKVDVSKGKIPTGIEVANVTGVVPESAGYKRGWTKTGWLVDKFSDRGNVLLSPTYHLTDEACENTLTFPMLEISAGEVLTWQARSVYDARPDSYRVEARAEGETAWTTLADVNPEANVFTPRAVDLSAYAGRNVKLRFTATGSGYLLALTDVEVSTPTKPVIASAQTVRRYFGQDELTDGMVSLNVRLRNGAAPLKGASIVCRDAAGKTVFTRLIERKWKSGEELNLNLSVPAKMDEKTAYNIICVTADGTESAPIAGWTFASAFSRRLLVDEGTGMWCVNCPTGTLTLNKLHQEYGDQIIGVTTHINTTATNDMLTNPVYFGKLNYRDIPKMMLNRIASTMANGAENFGNNPFTPVSFGIEMTAPQTLTDGTATATVKVRVAAQTDNSADRYRVGYVGIKTYSGVGNDDWYQRNNCALVSNDEYYYLPSTIPAPLCLFHNVSVTSDTAFTGIEQSLPATLQPGQDYACTVTAADVPEGTKLVVFVLDTQTGEMLNSVVEPEDLTAIDDNTDDNGDGDNGNGDNGNGDNGNGDNGNGGTTGADTIGADEVIAHPGVWTLTGIHVADTPAGLPAGLYIYNGRKLIIKNR